MNLSVNPPFVVTTGIKIYGAPLLVNILYEREMLNSTDRYAIAVLKDNVSVGPASSKGVIINIFFVYSKRWSYYLCCK